MNTQCLQEIDLEVYYAGDTSHDRARTIARHLSECNDCRDSYRGIISNQGVLSRIRHAVQLTGTDDPSAYLSSAHLERPSTTVPKHIQGYEIIRELQRGGQGVVYEANQLATRRRVAIKVLLENPLTDPHASRRRFENEIELASNLVHDHIVSIYDSGLVEGHYYYAMAYVDGPRLDEFVRSRELSIVERVHLFRDVCEAVAFAHEHGVIHRDLKPSNIRVEAPAKAMLLDFGLAKKLGIDNSTAMDRDQFIGTLAYAAPEQVDHDGRDTVDTRTDVYALGILFFETLTGTHPFFEQDKRPGSVKDILSRPAPHPSASNRRIDRDLDSIILKAMEREPAGRYASATHLLQDIDRYLQGQAVTARQASAWYVFGKFIRRHKPETAIAAVGLCLILGLTAWHVQTLSIARDRAIVAKQQEARASQAASEINLFYEDMLRAIRQDSASGQDLYLITQMLDHAAGQVEQQSMPAVVQSRLHSTLGAAYHNIGQHEAAAHHLQRALSAQTDIDQHPSIEIARCQNRLALLWKDVGRLQDAETLQREALGTVQGLLGRGPLWIEYTNDLGHVLQLAAKFDAAEEHYHAALAAALGTPSERASILNNLGTLYRDTGRWHEADECFRKSLSAYEAIMSDPLDTACVLSNIGALRRRQGSMKEALEYFNKARALRITTLGNAHLEVAQSHSDLAVVHSALGNTEQAQTLHERSLSLRVERLGPDHLLCAESRSNLALVLMATAQYEAAAEHLRIAVEILKQTYGLGHPRTATVLGNYAGVQARLGHHEQALEMFQQVLEYQRQSLGTEHVEVAKTLNNIAGIYRETRQFQRAIKTYSETLVIAEKAVGDKHYLIGDILNNLGLCFKRLGKFDDAETSYRRAIAVYEQSEATPHARTANALTNLGLLLRQRGSSTEAIRILERSLTLFESGLGRDHPKTKRTLAALISLQDASGNAKEANELRNQATQQPIAQPQPQPQIEDKPQSAPH